LAGVFVAGNALDSNLQKPTIEDIPADDPKRCYSVLKDKNIIRYESLPGNGWDNLRNKDEWVFLCHVYVNHMHNNIIFPCTINEAL
jgi:hypothetical protein